mgnify:FL=1
MDKYEYKLKVDQMKSLAAEGKYEEAVEIVDSINWRKIKNINALVKAGEIYEQVGRYDDSREVLLTAYDRSPIGRMIIYRLAEVAIKTGNFEEAKDYYEEFVEIAPHDNLKYVLKYKINKAQGADYNVLIGILEELKDREYSEEWSYELAFLYHKAGMAEKCVEACDELILWFGDGPYVEKAMELKMLYEPLTEQQEKKYRLFKQNQKGVVEVRPEDDLESGEIIAEPVEIPKVKMSPDRFNTLNLQEQLRESMREIMQATEKEKVDDTMNNIKKLVEDVPYLTLPEEMKEAPEAAVPEIQMPVEEASQETGADEAWPERAEENDSQKESDASGVDIDGQITYVDNDKDETTDAEDAEDAEKAAVDEDKVDPEAEDQPEVPADDPEVTASAEPQTDVEAAGQEASEEVSAEKPFDTQMSIEEILAQWEKTRQAAESAIQEVEDKKLQSAKEKALQEAGDLMDQLAAVIAKLEEEAEPEELPQTEQTEAPVQEDDAVRMVTNMNQLLQREIDRLSDETAQLDQKIADADQTAETGVDTDPAQEETETDTDAAEHDAQDAVAEGIRELLGKEEAIEAEPEYTDVTPEKVETFSEQQEEEEAEKEADALETALLAETVRQMTKDDDEEVLPQIADPETFELPNTISKLTKEQREIFTYFVPIDGMEKQICQALTGAMLHLTNGKNASTGNMIIQGGSGSGKTVLATNIVKVLQNETGKPAGKIGKVEASALNQKDAGELLKKVAGGCLIIEKAGELSKETAVKLAALLEQDTSGLLVIIEDTKRGIQKVLGRSESFAAKFSEKISIPIFTSDELVTFAKSYANELGYTIDDMGILALYNSISNIEHADRATTLAEVKEVVDRAVTHSEKGGLKKAFSILTSRRYDDQDYIILREKDFE